MPVISRLHFVTLEMTTKLKTKMAEHNELGKLGEQLARDFLIAKGYQILEQNWVCGHK